MFDYFVNSSNQDKNCALTLAGWIFQLNNQVLGGVPPGVDAIVTARGKVSTFVTTLFRS